MRVIAGRWKGRRLKSPAGDAVRPTTDRVKEALFNILGPAVNGSLFVDLCCGAGGLGIEALSRGAVRAVLVDSSRRSLETARGNLELCGAEEDRVRLVCSEAHAWLSRWSPDPDSWVLVADPPYQSGAAGAIMVEMERLATHPGFRAAIVEHGPGTPDLPDQPGGGRGLLSWSTRRYGESFLAVARRPNPDPVEGE